LVEGLRLVSAVCHPAVLRTVAGLIAAALFLRARSAGVGRADRATTRWLALFILVTIGVSGLFSSGFKALIGRSRPSLANPVAHAAGASFPSGHALTAMTTGIVVLTALWVLTGRLPPARAWGPVLLAVALTGFSRLGLGVHYLTDVLGGYLLGAAWALAMVAVFVRAVHRSHPTDPADPADPADPPDRAAGAEPRPADRGDQR